MIEHIHTKHIIIEGIDGVGKSTLTNSIYSQLCERYPTATVNRIRFPAYHTATGKLIQGYLNGQLYAAKELLGHGSSDDVDPYTLALPYTLDRRVYYENNPKDFDADFLVWDRSYLSNFLYFGSKFVDFNKLPVSGYTQRDVFAAIDTLNFKRWLTVQYHLEICNTPFWRDGSEVFPFYITLDTMNDVVRQLDGRNESKDIHESNTSFLSNAHRFAVEVWPEICDAIIGDFEPSTAAYLYKTYQYRIIGSAHIIDPVLQMEHNTKLATSIIDQLGWNYLSNPKGGNDIGSVKLQ